MNVNLVILVVHATHGELGACLSKLGAYRNHAKPIRAYKNC